MFNEARWKLWFDVGIKRYTTICKSSLHGQWLWFDVGIKRYTTSNKNYNYQIKLWFDVGIKRYTTCQNVTRKQTCCGLM